MSLKPPPTVEYYCRNCGHRSDKDDPHKCSFDGAVISFSVLFWVIAFIGGLYLSGKL